MNTITLIYSLLAGISFFLFCTKFAIHAFLDYKNGYKVKYSPFLAFEYILPYDKNVQGPYQTLKRRCNILYSVTIVIFGLALVILFVKNLTEAKMK